MFALQALEHLRLATLSCANQNPKLSCRPANHGPHFQPEFQVWLRGTALIRRAQGPVTPVTWHAQGPIIQHAQGPIIPVTGMHKALSPGITRPCVQSPAPEAKQAFDRQGKPDSHSGRRLDSLSIRQPDIVSTVSPACTVCQFGEGLMLPSVSPSKQPG